MPYISPGIRPSLDPHVAALAKQIQVLAKPGEELDILGLTNYTITRLVVLLMAGKMGKGYAGLAQACGVLTNVKDELYARYGRSYEDRKKLLNGDVFRELDVA